MACYEAAMAKVEKPRPYQDIADRLRAARDVIGGGDWTQEIFAAKAGLGHSQYKNWESGAYRIGLDGARALRKTYGLSLDFIYEGSLDALPMNLRNALSDKFQES